MLFCSLQFENRTVRLLTSCLSVVFSGYLVFSLGRASYAQTIQPGHAEPVGSLNSVGDVYVNDAPAPADYTIFTGDKVRTGATATAVFTESGVGTLKIAPQSEVRIAATYEYTAELEAGTVVVHSIAGPHEMTLRMQNYVLIPSVQQESTTSKIERGSDGAFLVSCLDGSIGVLTLVGSSGQFLQAGQSVRIFSKPGLGDSRPPMTGAFGKELPHKKGWSILGLTGAGAGALAFELSQGKKSSPSPSTP